MVSHAKEAAERHDRIGDFSGRFVDHHIVNRAEISCRTPPREVLASSHVVTLWCTSISLERHWAGPVAGPAF
jgi:hypothetical protein